MERSQLLAVSREIEDRAFRVGAGELRVSFQTRASLAAQVDVYRHLASDTAFDIHVHVPEGWTPPEIPDLTYHEFPAETLDRYWVLAFDGGSDGSQACGLVAREQQDGYEGFWTDAPGLVGEIFGTLEGV